MICIMTAAVLALTMAACGGGSSSGGGGEKPAAGGGETESTDTNCVYSAEQIISANCMPQASITAIRIQEAMYC